MSIFEDGWAIVASERTYGFSPHLVLGSHLFCLYSSRMSGSIGRFLFQGPGGSGFMGRKRRNCYFVGPIDGDGLMFSGQEAI